MTTEELAQIMTCFEVKRLIEAAVLAEREACAKVCDDIEQHELEDDFDCGIRIGANWCAAAIRAIKFEGDTGFRPVSEMVAEHKQDPKKAAAIEKAKMRKAEQKPVAVVEITYGRDPECYVTGNIDNFPEGVFKLYAAPVDAKAIRAEALEEAAKVCEEVAKHYITNHKEQEQVWLLAATSDCAAAIRGLK